MEKLTDLKWKYVGISLAIALVAAMAYDYVLKDYMPWNKTDKV